jgi:hypothetical protein
MTENSDDHDARWKSQGPGLIAVPAREWLWTESAIAIYNLERPRGSLVMWQPGGATLDLKRNTLVQEFLARPELQWCFFCDTDMTPPPDTISRLLATDLDIVGAACCGRVPPFPSEWGTIDPVTGRGKSGGMSGELEEVEWVGAGALLIRRNVLERMASPWFVEIPGWANNDVGFCRGARATGFRIFVDQRIVVGQIVPGPLEPAIGPKDPRMWLSRPLPL